MVSRMEERDSHQPMFVLLDLDDTLVDKSRAFARWAQLFVDSMGLDDSDALTWLLTTDRRIRQRGPFFAEVARRWPAVGDPQRVWDDYVRAMPTLVEPFPGVIDGLTRLRAAGHQLVVVTNGRQENQEGKLRATGLRDLVDGWVISDVLGHRKPEPEIYSAALDLLGSPDPRLGWMIGDDPHLDMAPAHALGMRSVWISHGHEWAGSLPSPTLIAPTPADAVHAVA